MSDADTLVGFDSSAAGRFDHRGFASATGPGKMPGTQGREGAADVNRRNVAVENDRLDRPGTRGRNAADPAPITVDHASQDSRAPYEFSPATLRAPNTEFRAPSPELRAPGSELRAPEARTPGRETDAPRPSNERISRLVTRLADAIGPGSYERYFARQAKIELREDALELTVQSEFVAGLLDRRFGQQIREALRHAPSGDTLPIRFRVDRDAFSDGAPRQAEADQSPRTLPAPRAPELRTRRTGPAAAARNTSQLRHSLDDFVVGACNRLAYAAAVRVAEEKGSRSFSSLFIHGTCGLGKTHLLQGLARRFAQLNPGAVIRYTTAEAFTNEFITSMKSGTVDAFRKSLRRVDLLCLDDVHFLANKEATQAELLHSFDALDLDGARLVLASDEHPREIRKLSEQLTSRFLAGAVVKLEPPDPETRVKLVRHIGARKGLHLDEPAVRLIAERSGRSVGSLGGFCGSVREIEGLVTQVEAVHRLLPEYASTDGMIGLVLVRKALGLSDNSPAASENVGVPRVRRPIHAEQVLNEVCKALRVDVSELMGRGRHPRVVLARSITAHLSRRLTTMSYPEIARAMNRPNHSTVITACKRLAGAMERQERPSPTLELGAELAGLTLSELCDNLSARVQRAVAG